MVDVVDLQPLPTAVGFMHTLIWLTLTKSGILKLFYQDNQFPFLPIAHPTRIQEFYLAVIPPGTTTEQSINILCRMLPTTLVSATTIFFCTTTALYEIHRNLSAAFSDWHYFLHLTWSLQSPTKLHQCNFNAEVCPLFFCFSSWWTLVNG